MPLMNRIEARTTLAETFKRFIRGVSMISGARRAAELYGHSGAPGLLREGIQALQFLRRSGLTEPVIGRLLSSSGGEQGYIQNVIDHQTNSFAAVVDSASLIAAHTLLDDALTRYCQVSVTFDPDAWESLVLQKKVELSEVKDRSYEELRDEALANHLAKLEGESLPRRYDALMRILRPSPQESEKLDRNLLVQLDNLRHDIVHRSGFRALPTFNSDFEFLQANAFLACISRGSAIQTATTQRCSATLRYHNRLG